MAPIAEEIYFFMFSFIELRYLQPLPPPESIATLRRRRRLSASATAEEGRPRLASYARMRLCASAGTR